MSVREISLSGTYYEVGKALGSAAEKEVKHILEVFQQSKLYKRLQEYLASSEGTEQLQIFERLTEKHCSAIVSELRGLSDGANVDYKQLFLLNLEPEWVALFSDVPYAGHGIQYASTFEGCTDIHLPINGCQQVYLAHTEDIGPDVKDFGFLVHHSIYDKPDCNASTEPLECFTDYILPGVLAGSKFGFNRHGLMYGNNNIYQEGITSAGIPRRFAFRAIISSKNVHEATKKLTGFPGIATAGNFNFLYKEDMHGTEKVVSCSFEMAGDQASGVQIRDYYPQGVYIHCNTFQHLRRHCHPEESSLRRAVVLKQLVSRNQLSTHSDLLKALSNQDDQEYPVFRTGKSPDYLCTAAVGVFDSLSMTLTVYGGPPDKSSGQVISVLKYQTKDQSSVKTC